MSLCTNARRLWQRIMTVTGIGYAGDTASGSHRLGVFLEAHI
ncbi:hypothetical protein SAMN04487951_1106 [Vreelandella arcis]|uniref:Uncharacterized protein n=1 Tax=Vreelandella arcis TaxID=416873 RepID=A0A1H0FH26_9GAMM|nr:hypothetical protein SAMN04487951_1106 [Halomonas arcis]